VTGTTGTGPSVRGGVAAEGDDEGDAFGDGLGDAAGACGVEDGDAGALEDDGSVEGGAADAAGRIAGDASPQPASARLSVSTRAGSAARPAGKGWFTGPIVPPSPRPALARVDP
jgi:hypothetical protein